MRKKKITKQKQKQKQKQSVNIKIDLSKKTTSGPRKQDQQKQRSVTQPIFNITSVMPSLPATQQPITPIMQPTMQQPITQPASSVVGMQQPASSVVGMQQQPTPALPSRDRVAETFYNRQNNPFMNNISPTLQSWLNKPSESNRSPKDSETNQYYELSSRAPSKIMSTGMSDYTFGLSSRAPSEIMSTGMSEYSYYQPIKNTPTYYTLDDFSIESGLSKYSNYEPTASSSVGWQPTASSSVGWQPIKNKPNKPSLYDDESSEPSALVSEDATRPFINPREEQQTKFSNNLDNNNDVFDIPKINELDKVMNNLTLPFEPTPYLEQDPQDVIVGQEQEALIGLPPQDVYNEMVAHQKQGYEDDLANRLNEIQPIMGVRTSKAFEYNDKFNYPPESEIKKNKGFSNMGYTELKDLMIKNELDYENLTTKQMIKSLQEDKEKYPNSYKNMGGEKYIGQMNKDQLIDDLLKNHGIKANTVDKEILKKELEIARNKRENYYKTNKK